MVWVKGGMMGGQKLQWLVELGCEWWWVVLQMWVCHCLGSAVSIP